MSAPKMTISQFRNLTIEQAVTALDITPTDNTYVYLTEKMELCAMEIRDHSATPEDEFLTLGFVSSYR